MEEDKSAIVDDFVDSDDENEKKDEEKEKSVSVLTITGSLPQQVKNILVLEHGNAQALSKIIFHDKIEEVGKAETTYKEKTQDTLKIYYVP